MLLNFFLCYAACLLVYRMPWSCMDFLSLCAEWFIAARHVLFWPGRCTWSCALDCTNTSFQEWSWGSAGGALKSAWVQHDLWLRKALCWWLGELMLFWNAQPEQLFSQTASWNNRKKESKHAVSPPFSSWFALQEGVRQWGKWVSFKVENICIGQVTFTAAYFWESFFGSRSFKQL